VSFGTANPSLSTIKVGSFIVAQGTVSADGKTLTATRVMIAPAMKTSAPGTFPRGLWPHPGSAMPHPFHHFGGPHDWGGSMTIMQPSTT
jgi:hypothetical protein